MHRSTQDQLCCAVPGNEFLGHAIMLAATRTHKERYLAGFLDGVSGYARLIKIAKMTWIQYALERVRGSS